MEIWLDKAKKEVDRAKAILRDKLDKDSVKHFVEHVSEALVAISKLILKEEHEYIDIEDIGDYNIKSEFFEFFYYVQTLLNKEYIVSDKGITIKNWKSSKTIKKQDLKAYLDETIRILEDVQEEMAIKK